MAAIAVTGIAGRMGRVIAQCVIENPSTTLSGALESEGHPSIGKDAGIMAGLEKTGVKVTDRPVQAFRRSDVIIDFTAPEGSIKNLEASAVLKKPAVVGTTGFSVRERERIKELAAEIPLVFSPNMSVGVNLLFKLVESAACVLRDYDIEIVEAHHRHKVDAPSGTAVRIAEILAQTLKRNLEKDAVYGRKGITGQRNPRSIGVLSVRGGDITGDHTVMFCGEGERIELIHRAHSRATFARGAVRAALWLKDKKPGLYDMADVLGLRQG